MIRRLSLLGAVLGATLLAAAPAGAVVSVYLSPGYQEVLSSDGSATVDIYADIPNNEAIIGWGLDLTLIGSSVAIAGSPEIGPAWIPVLAPDGDGLAGAAPFPGNAVFGTVLLATVTFDLVEMGYTELVLGDSHPADLTEGFPLNPPPVGAYAQVNYVNDPVNKIGVDIPEPASLALLLLGSVVVGYRRA